MTRPMALLAALAVSLAPSLGSAAAPPAAAARTAIVVGANAAALGRAGLRHAHRDSDAIGEVLRSVGRFDARRVHVLHDPTPDEIVRLVEREAAALAGDPQGMLLFYYSGHADRDALYPGGRPLPLDRLRRVLDRPDVAVRVGVIDACQGGAWTRAKGLVPDAPFEVTIPAVLGSAGSALIASSSGVESAHESDLLQGSFFTYHFAAALRGAGDQSGDGVVTLTEAYEYARERTIRDSARLSPEPQHPSYALNLRGRQDLVLAHVADSPSTLALEQQEGPLELVHLASGLRVLELPAGERSVTLAVPPGKYLVRRVAQEGIRTREIDVPRAGAAAVREGELVLLGTERLVVKGASGGGGALPGHRGWDVELGVDTGPQGPTGRMTYGVGDPTPGSPIVRLDGRLGLTDRLTWKIGTLAFAYGFGEPGRTELVPYAGVLSWNIALDARGLGAAFGAGAGARRRLGPAAVVATLGVETPLFVDASEATYDWLARGALGLTLHLGPHVTFHFAAALDTLEHPTPSAYGWGSLRETALTLGSVQQLGLERLPLLALHWPRAWSLNLYGTVDAHEGSAAMGLSKAF